MVELGFELLESKPRAYKLNKSASFEYIVLVKQRHETGRSSDLDINIEIIK